MEAHQLSGDNNLRATLTLGTLVRMTGLRELKKQRTRQLICDAAFELFAEDGFDQVSVAAIARRAEVSEATVFNYFRTKEDLIFSRLEQFEAALVTAIRDRPAGQTVVAAFGAFI